MKKILPLIALLGLITSTANAQVAFKKGSVDLAACVGICLIFGI